MRMKKKPFSKLIVSFVIIFVTAFIVFCCYEMHRLGDLSPISYIGTGMVALLSSVVAAYMWRAKQQDMFNLELEKIKEKAKLKEELGENYENQTVTEVTDEEDCG